MAKYEMDDTKRILARVQKCLNIAHCEGAAQEERDTAMRMAHAILAKHNLDLAQVGALEGQASMDAMEPRVENKGVFGGWPWALQVCSSIASLFFCHYIVVKNRRSTHFTTHCFIGRTSNAVTASTVAEFVVKSVYSEACRQMRAQREGYPYLRAFCWGAQQAIARRVRELRVDPEQVKESTQRDPGTALVLASLYDTEAEANRRFIEQLYPHLRTMRSRTKGLTNAEAMQRGREFGNNVSLSPQLKGGR